MQIALDKNNNRVCAEIASKENTYYCPICNESLILKKGKVNIDHFAHFNSECTDKWNYDMSEWHYNMQNRFRPEQREVVVKHNGQVHRADILYNKKVIEFQNSTITAEEIAERNTFYNSAGYDVAWVFNVQEQYDLERIYWIESKENKLLLGWKYAMRCLKSFPTLNKYNKNIILYLYWIDENNEEFFNKVIWTLKDENGDIDLKRFIIDENICIDFKEKMSVEDFFKTKDDIIKEHLNSLNCNYKIKYDHIKGHKRIDYLCPLTNELCHWNICKYCRYCGAIKKVGKTQELIYCCYPKQVNESQALSL